MNMGIISPSTSNGWFSASSARFASAMQQIRWIWKSLNGSFTPAFFGGGGGGGRLRESGGGGFAVSIDSL